MNEHPDITAKGALFVVAAPSGAGKTSLVKAVVERDARLTVSVSHTTRPRRPGEEEGVAYHFVSQAQFEAMIGEGAFLEHARVFGNYYGTSSAWVDARLDEGRDVILEIDWQGAEQVRRLRPETVGIFILPPSRATLEARLRGRGADDEATIAHRLAEAREEMSHHVEFDYLIVNDDFDIATDDLLAVFRAERSRLSRVSRDRDALLVDLLSPER
ncbi:MAG: guanylate kinase [Pseudomonadales bacterium]|nr:guanylate kinase [Pseudomonadales bacterium]